MASKIKVDNIANQCGGAVVTKCGATTTISGSVVKADDIQAADGGNLINQCGTTITLGASGDTINLASGASQTGFGRTGTVDWDTTAKTGDFTAVSGNGYFVNTTSSAITVTMPASPSAGDIVALSDYAKTWGTNNVNLSSAPYNGETGTPILSTPNQTVFLVYVDGTKGWITTNESTTRLSGFAGITATGGTVTTCGDYTIHTFTGPGSFCVSALGTCNSIEYLVVAGGGGGGANGGGGGAGGFRFAAPSLSPLSYPAKPLSAPTGLTATVTSYPITVGGGGSNTTFGTGTSTSGANSVFSTITSAGGGHGGSTPSPFPGAGAGGGSGGGGGGASLSGGPGNSPAVSPPQGNDGGTSASPNANYGGGGGALAVGANGTAPFPGGPGGVGGGLPSGFGTSGESSGGYYYFSGGGGGGTNVSPGGPPGGSGGLGGGGNGSLQEATGEAGTANTGGGGGGSAGGSSPGSGAGGSGIVIIRYKFQ